MSRLDVIDEAVRAMNALIIYLKEHGEPLDPRVVEGDYGVNSMQDAERRRIVRKALPQHMWRDDDVIDSLVESLFVERG